MRRKVKIIKELLISSGGTFLVKDNYGIIIVGLQKDDFLLMDVDGNVINPYSVEESNSVLGKYDITFGGAYIDKIRIKRYRYSTRFVKLRYNKINYSK